MGEAPPPTSHLAETVKLEARDGALVGWTEVPKHRPCVDVLLWGARIFRYRDVKPGYLVYIEASMFTIRGMVIRPGAPPPTPPAESA